MTTKARKVPPVFQEMVAKRLTDLLRIGEPFRVADVPDKAIAEFVVNLEPEERYGVEPAAAITLMVHNILKSLKFRERAFRRWDRGTMKYESRGHSTVVYPSNDRERFNLKDYEVLLPWHKTAKEAEPPLITRETKQHFGYPTVEAALAASEAVVGKPTIEVEAEPTLASDATPAPFYSQLPNVIALQAAHNCLEAARIGARMCTENVDRAMEVIRALEATLEAVE